MLMNIWNFGHCEMYIFYGLGGKMAHKHPLKNIPTGMFYLHVWNSVDMDHTQS